MQFVEAPADVVRSIIAHVFCEAEMKIHVDSKLGDVTLRDHQVTAVQFASRALNEFGGAFIGDDVGLGKTYVALALARNRGKTAVVAPAVLREMWRSASHRTGVAADFISFESLSRAKYRGAYNFVIVDEAHHVRNPATRRYGNLIQLTHGAQVLLLSATPVHNKRKDLEALLAIFLGARTLTNEELARCMVRRDKLPDDLINDGKNSGIPRVLPTTPITLPADDAFLQKIIALPPPIPSRDGGQALKLTTLALARQWSSSDAALRGALKRRLARSVSLMHVLQAGRYPSKAELRAWVVGESTIQLAFPELMAQQIDDQFGGSSHKGSILRLLQTVEEHSDALRELLCSIPDRDSYRVSEIRRLRSLHKKIIAFSQYSDTVAYLFRALQNDGGVAMLTARGGYIASGPINRNDIIAQLYSDSPVDRVNLLITTDLLSEGVNLQAADTVVHLDLPWTPARLKQRVGRVARLGSEHNRVFVYKVLPPASAEAVIRAESILNAKITIANDATDAANNAERTRITMRSWMNSSVNDHKHNLQTTTPAVAAVHANTSGFIAAVRERGNAAIVSDMQYIPEGNFTATQIDPAQLEAAKRKLAEWAVQRSVARKAAPTPIATARKRILNRIDAIVTRTPIHLRTAVIAEASKAREAAMSQVGAATERQLAQLAQDREMTNVEWLKAIVESVGIGVSSGVRSSNSSHEDTPVSTDIQIPALLIFQPDSD